MRIKDITDENAKRQLKITDLENIFNVYTDDNGRYFFNLNNTIVFNFKKENLNQYKLNHDMYWPLISYKIYGTTRLAWLLMKLNEVQTDQIFDIKHAGDDIAYVSKSYIESILQELTAES